MKAILCTSYGVPESLEFKEIPAPTINPDQVLVQVKACGLNFPDLLQIQNKYQVKPELPFSPGGEISGVILSVGKNVKHVKVNDRVLGLCGWGGLAEEIAVHATRIFPLPDEIDFITGASTLYTYGTSYHALKDRADLKSDETILVLGAAGGVGLAAVKLAKIMGATVIAAASSDEKLFTCKEEGADFTINYLKEDLRARIKDITNDKGVDVVYDPVGGEVAEAALRSIAWKGRYLVVGFASGNIPKFANNLPLLKGCSIVGVFWGRFSELEPEKNAAHLADLFQLIKEGKIKPHIHKIFQLKDSARALSELMGRMVIGKAVVKIGD